MRKKKKSIYDVLFSVKDGKTFDVISSNFCDLNCMYEN